MDKNENGQRIYGTHHPPCGGTVVDFDLHWDGPDADDVCCSTSKCVQCGMTLTHCSIEGWKHVACINHRYRLDWCPPSCRG